MDMAIKRVYDDPSDEDGYRILVDRLWPRGISKERAAIREWLKELGPSTELRHWFGHDPAKYPEFRKRYRTELAAAEDLWRPVLDRAESERVTLVYSAADTEHNQAVVLREYLIEQG